MDTKDAQRIKDSDAILRKIQDDGLEEHSGFLLEAVEYYMLDVLQDEDFERLKKDYKIK